MREKLISLAATGRPMEIDDTSAASMVVPPPTPLEWLRFAILRDAPRMPGGRYLGMETAPVEPWPHQHVVARRLIDTWPYSYLLCDEVGLGKTIESGLALRSLILSGLVKRALIAAPAHVAPQWQREMAEKFFLPFGRALGGSQARHAWLLPFEREEPATSLFSTDLTIVSTGLVSRQDRRQELAEAADFDVVLLDEAHYARRKNAPEGITGAPEYNNLFKLAEHVLRPKTRSLLLATATPMQLDRVEAFDLMRLTRRSGPFLEEPTVADLFYALLGEMRSGGDLEGDVLEFLHAAVDGLREADPAQWHFIEQTVIKGRFRRDIERWLTNPMAGLPAAGRRGVQRLMFAASPLARVMLRHTRRLLEEYRRRGELSGRLAKRIILPVPEINFNEQERRVYERFEPYCKELGERIAQATNNRTAIGFLLSFLRLRFASSLFAIRRTLERRHEKVSAALRRANALAGELSEEDLSEAFLEESEDDEAFVSALLKRRSPEDLTWEKKELEKLLADLANLSERPSKVKVLLDQLEARRLDDQGRIKQTVIFTRFYDTLTDLADRLLTANPLMHLGCFAGPACRYWDVRANVWRNTSREDIKRRFLQGRIDVLLCTDAAAEGLNLQTADLLVNYDLPWNPMKVEQRIGRIDRIGQKHDEIFVLNLCYPGSAEDIVYVRLLKRLESVIDVVGAQQITMIPVEPEEFARLADGDMTPEELEIEALQRVETLKQRNDVMEIPPDELYDMYSRLAQDQAGTPLPLTLDGIFQILESSAYLQALGCETCVLPEGKALLLKNIPGVTDGALLTASRTLFEAGSGGLEAPIYFATWGDPAFEAVLAAVLSFDAPEGIQRVEVPLEDSQASRVGYAVGVGADARLVTALADVTNLPDALSALSGDTIAVCETELLSRIQDEVKQLKLAAWVEQRNANLGGLQRALMYYLTASLFEEGLESLDTNFRMAAGTLAAKYADRRVLRLRRVPSDPFVGQLGLLFETTPIATSPGKGYVDVPHFLIEHLFNLARREAQAMKVAATELTVRQVVERLRREASRGVS